MATPTNPLTSHSGEHSSYPADKPIPRAVMKGGLYGRSPRFIARQHNKRSKRYALQQAQREADEVSLRSSAD